MQYIMLRNGQKFLNLLVRAKAGRSTELLRAADECHKKGFAEKGWHR